MSKAGHFHTTGNLVARPGVQLTSEIQGSAVSNRAYNWIGVAMKLRILVVIAALLTFSYAAPSSFSQDQGSPSPGVSGTPAPTDKTAAQTDNTPPTTPTVSPADPDKVKHDGGKNDVDAIGNRKMGGRGMGNWYSIESEIRMGKEYAQQVEAR